MSEAFNAVVACLKSTDNIVVSDQAPHLLFSEGRRFKLEAIAEVNHLPVAMRTSHTHHAFNILYIGDDGLVHVSNSVVDGVMDYTNTSLPATAVKLYNARVGDFYRPYEIKKFTML